MAKEETKKAEEKKKPEAEEVKFKGKYIEAVGKRKTSIAQVRLYKNGKGIIIVNGQKLNSYFSANNVAAIFQPLKLTGTNRDFNFSIHVTGGGKNGQAEAVRHGITRILVKMNEELKPALKAKGFFTRDARKKERKKPGLKKARRAPQWSKR